MLSLSRIASHVPNLAGAKVPHPCSAQLETSSPAETPQRPIGRRRTEQMDASNDLSDSGITVLGNVGSTLVENVRRYAQSSATNRLRYQRQTELEWNGDCDAVFDHFETVSWQSICVISLLC